jgi:hypothetical protein
LLLAKRLLISFSFWFHSNLMIRSSHLRPTIVLRSFAIWVVSFVGSLSINSNALLSDICNTLSKISMLPYPCSAISSGIISFAILGYPFALHLRRARRSNDLYFFIFDALSRFSMSDSMNARALASSAHR